MTGGGPNYEKQGEGLMPEDLVLPPRKERIDEVLSHRTRTFTVVLDRLEDHFNMAAVLRTCEGMGVQEVHIVKNPKVPWTPNWRVTQGCDKWLDLHLYDTFAACRDALKARGFRVLVSAIREGGQSLFDVDFSPKVAIVFGNERYGVSEEVLSLADGTFWIPMFGFTQSFNISAAASACVSRAIAWRLQKLGKVGDLTPAELAELREKFLMLSVKQRKRLTF
jgi:tRNA (guanosine-2'-O-)-methyltransferase